MYEQAIYDLRGPYISFLLGVPLKQKNGNSAYRYVDASWITETGATQSWVRFRRRLQRCACPGGLTLLRAPCGNFLLRGPRDRAPGI